MGDQIIRIGAVADIHYSRDKETRLKPLFEHAARSVDILLLGGDLTDYGMPEEVDSLVRDLKVAADIPIIAVLGNHDFESGREQEVMAILRAGGVRVLDGDTCEVRGIGIAGVKGFGGGFARGTLEPWGEAGVKRFVQEAVDEAMKLERALARITAPTRIALLHYAPIRDTVVGEPEEIFGFLGSGRLEEPLHRYGVTAVFHGHAHKGAPEGKTSGGIPVYNVALPVLRRIEAQGPPLRILELPVYESPTR
ncbi:MAG: metallophosphoesterase [Gemmataceae bacterium]|nr:metallophosphoesterase [Gemmataceae bacterium]